MKFMFLQGNMVNKSVFVIFFQGDQLKSRVKKICEGWVLLAVIDRGIANKN